MSTSNGFAQFKISPNEFLGNDYSTYRQNAFGLSVGSPAVYMELRKSVIENLKKKAIGNLYETIYNAMSAGTDAGGDDLGVLAAGLGAPKIPPNEINNLALSCAKTLSEYLDQVCEKLLPLSFKSVADARLELKGTTDAYSI